MAWTYLIIAGILEIGWAIGLKFSDGFSKPVISAATLAAMAASFAFLSLALRTAYAVWTGIGAAGTALVGILCFHEPRSALRLACLVLIVAGVTGLKFASPQAPAE